MDGIFHFKEVLKSILEMQRTVKVWLGTTVLFKLINVYCCKKIVIDFITE